MFLFLFTDRIFNSWVFNEVDVRSLVFSLLNKRTVSKCRQYR